MTDDFEILIDYIDKAFERQEYESRWLNEQGEYLSADIGYAYEWWKYAMKPELRRVFG